MKLWKRDTENWTVREVEGELWPGKDVEGDTCYENTHFTNEKAAWESLVREARAGVTLAGSRVLEARKSLRDAEVMAADAAAAMCTVQRTLDGKGF